MKILIICTASAKIGLGHLIRSRTLAESLINSKENIDLDYIIIGDRLVDNLLQDVSFKYRKYQAGEKITLAAQYDLAFFDTIPLEMSLFLAIKKSAQLCISISPIFDHMDKVDILFNRTKYIKEAYQGLNIQKHLGLEFTLIQRDCQKIATHIYEYNLQRERFDIAISMGGGDAPNKTLRFLNNLKKCPIPATFWVMLGEGYGHSYDDLIAAIKTDHRHEIVLAKTNRSMWHILRNCVMAILPGGITSYEAVYAGLPSINIIDKASSAFLIKEIEAKKACFYGGVLGDESLDLLNKKIIELYEDRNLLLQTHLFSKQMIDDKAGLRILEICKQELAKTKASF